MTLGETFRQAREALGLSIAEMAAKTKISAQSLSQMEADNYSFASAPVYGCGFVKIYAKALGLDPDVQTAVYKAVYAAPERPRPAAAVPLQTFGSEDSAVALRTVRSESPAGAQRAARQHPAPQRPHAMPQAEEPEPAPTPPPAPAAPEQEPDLFSYTPPPPPPPAPLRQPIHISAAEAEDERPAPAPAAPQQREPFRFPLPPPLRTAAPQREEACAHGEDSDEAYAERLERDEIIGAAQPAPKPKRRFGTNQLKTEPHPLGERLKGLAASAAAALGAAAVFLKTLLSKNPPGGADDPDEVAAHRRKRIAALCVLCSLALIALISAFSGGGDPADGGQGGVAESGGATAPEAAYESGGAAPGGVAELKIIRVAQPPDAFAD